jgi:hypothetical protein
MPSRKVANASQHIDDDQWIAASVIRAVEEDLGNMAAVSFSIQGSVQLVLVVGETLRQGQFVGVHEDGKARALGLAVDEFEHLLPPRHLVFNLGVHHVIKNDVERAALGRCGNVNEDIRRQRRRIGSP